MFDPEKLNELLAELQSLNGNLRDSRAAMHGLQGELKTLNVNMKNLKQLSRQLAVLNNILLQVGKTAGGVGVVQALVTGLQEMGRRLK